MGTGDSARLAAAQRADAGGAGESDDLATAIARQIRAGGEYQVTYLPNDPQRLVDLRWAALAAGRMLSRRVDVTVSRATAMPGHTPITVRMTCAVEGRPTIPRQRRRES